MRITTRYTSNNNGTGQVLAKGGGKQRTVNWNHIKSNDWNHGNAAGTLALVLFQGDQSRAIAAKVATHKVTETNTHIFDFKI